MNRRMMMSYIMSHQSRLPAEFQEVEYIESTGTQYIDSGVVSNDNSKSICEISFGNITSQQLNGTYASPTFRFQFGILGNTIPRQFYAGLGSKSQYFTLPIDSNKHTFELDAPNKTLSIDNESYVDNTITYGSNIYSFGLFARINANQGVDLSLACTQKLYSCKIYDNSVLVRNFVPCYRKADNVAGLYDLVNGVFYTNAGTGTFIVGGNV